MQLIMGQRSLIFLFLLVVHVNMLFAFSNINLLLKIGLSLKMLLFITGSSEAGSSLWSVSSDDCRSLQSPCCGLVSYWRF